MYFCICYIGLYHIKQCCNMYKAQKLYHFGQREARPTALFEASKLQALFRGKSLSTGFLSIAKTEDRTIQEFLGIKTWHFAANAPVPDARAYTGSTGIDEFFRGSERLHLASSPQANGLEDEVASCNVKRMDWWIDHLNFWLRNHLLSRKILENSYSICPMDSKSTYSSVASGTSKEPQKIPPHTNSHIHNTPTDNHWNSGNKKSSWRMLKNETWESRALKPLPDLQLFLHKIHHWGTLPPPAA